MAGKYVAYWDITRWQCNVEIMLPRSSQGDFGYYHLRVFARDGTPLISDTGRVKLYETKNVSLNDLVRAAYPPSETGPNPDDPVLEGLVMVTDAANEDDEFVSVMKLHHEDEDFKQQRYIPFTRLD